MVGQCAIALGLLLAPPPPTLPPSGAQVRGEQQARHAEAAASPATSSTPEGLGLHAHTEGGYLYRDPGARFTARIDADGTVYFADRFKKPAKRTRLRRRQRGTCCGTPPGGIDATFNVLAGAPAAGPTEWAFRVHGADPAAIAKAQFLKRTAALRRGLAERAMRAAMAENLDQLEDSLQRLWADDAIPTADRRAIVFARWDDLVDAVPGRAELSAVDAQRVVYAQRARRRIEAFVRRELPRDSGAGFSDDELARLNAQRKATVAFAPYRIEAQHD